MGRQEPQKCPLYAWLSFRGCPPPPPAGLWRGGLPGRLEGIHISSYSSVLSLCFPAPSRAEELRRVGGADGGGWASNSGP